MSSFIEKAEAQILPVIPLRGTVCFPSVQLNIDVMRRIADEAKNDPELVKTAPHKTPIGRVDDVLAAKHPIVTYRQLVNDKQQ